MEKRDVKPFVNTAIKDIITKISFLTGHSVKKIGEDLCKHAVDKNVGKELKNHFKRSIEINGVNFEGLKGPEKFERKPGEIERLSLTVDNEIYEYAYKLSYAIGCSVAKVFAYFIESSMDDIAFLDSYIINVLSKNIAPGRKELLRKIIKDINENHSTKANTVSALLLYIVDHYKQPGEKLDNTLESFVSGWK